MTGISSQFHHLQVAIRFAEQNHRVTGQNLANVNTPNYKAKELQFDQLMSNIKNLRTGESLSAEFSLVNTPGLPARSDGNNVDMDREIALLKKNTLAYQTLTQLLGAKMGILKQSIES